MSVRTYKMSRVEELYHHYIYDILRQQGYPKYAELFLNFDLMLDTRVDKIAWTKPGKALIGINPTVDGQQAGLLIRHELLHNFLDHRARLIEHLRKRHAELGDLDDMGIDELNKYLDREANTKKVHTPYNIAGDFEISNLGYTEEDKEIVRNIKLNGRLVSGLVTEDSYPDWTNLSLEEMYDKLQEVANRDEEKAKEDAKDGGVVIGSFINEKSFHGIDGRTYGA